MDLHKCLCLIPLTIYWSNSKVKISYFHCCQNQLLDLISKWNSGLTYSVSISYVLLLVHVSTSYQKWKLWLDGMSVHPLEIAEKDFTSLYQIAFSILRKNINNVIIDNHFLALFLAIKDIRSNLVNIFSLSVHLTI